MRYTLADGQQLKNHDFTQEMLEGRTIWEAFPQEIAEEWIVYYERALAGEHISFELDPPEGWFQIDVLPVLDEDDAIFAGMVMWQDITDRRTASSQISKRANRGIEIFSRTRTTSSMSTT